MSGKFLRVPIFSSPFNKNKRRAYKFNIELMRSTKSIGKLNSYLTLKYKFFMSGCWGN